MQQLVVVLYKLYKKQGFPDSTENSTGKYQNTYFHCGDRFH